MWPSELLFRRAKVEINFPLYSTLLHFSSLLLKTLILERILCGATEKSGLPGLGHKALNYFTMTDTKGYRPSRIVEQDHDG
jgi:hypothetical protein